MPQIINIGGRRWNIPPQIHSPTVETTNTAGFIYIRGNANTIDSIRLLPDENNGVRCERQVQKGIWKLASLDSSLTERTASDFLTDAPGDSISDNDGNLVSKD